MIYDANLSVASIVPLFYNEGVEQIKERMGAIMNFKKKIELITMISLLAMFLLFIGGYAIGALLSRNPVPAISHMYANISLGRFGRSARILMSGNPIKICTFQTCLQKSSFSMSLN